jgi:flavin reductase (DIM6/NTAB) family NADH-FMN oxidoreductase RutF
MSVDQQIFKQVMRQFVSGVTVVTTQVNNQLTGATVSAFAPLSLEPPLVLICLGTQRTCHTAIAMAGMFAVNILDEQQEDVSRRFGSCHAEKFIAGCYTLSAHGLPLLCHALALIECRVSAALPGGDHTIFVGEVLHAQAFEGQPLVYYQSRYHRLAPSVEGQDRVTRHKKQTIHAGR